jgi:hypothetical protein
MLDDANLDRRLSNPSDLFCLCSSTMGDSKQASGSKPSKRHRSRSPKERKEKKHRRHRRERRDEQADTEDEDQWVEKDVVPVDVSARMLCN